MEMIRGRIGWIQFSINEIHPMRNAFLMKRGRYKRRVLFSAIRNILTGQ